MSRERGDQGFTLIELMLVVAILSLLAAIAIPKFGNMIIKAKEAAVKANLGALRGALTIYYSDNEGMYPYFRQIPEALTTANKYMDAIPAARPPQGNHEPMNYINTAASPPVNVTDAPLGGVGWYYAYFPSMFTPYGFPGPMALVVACTHHDSTGRTWSTW